MKRPSQRPRGVSLVEAMVAFLVMGFGMLAIIGVQATLRFNSDTAKQRSEAVRLAQEEIENLRAFTQLDATPGARSFDTITADESARPVTGITNANTVYSVRRTLGTPPADAPDMRMLQVEVAWDDRQGAQQLVRLSTVIAGLPPALSGYLGLLANGKPKGDVRGRAGGRLPFYVKDLGDGTSAYKPVANSTIGWRFDNTTGFVTSRCTVPVGSSTQSLVGDDFVGCISITGYLVIGAVRFAQDHVGPLDAQDAEFPDSVRKSLSLTITLQGSNYADPAFECFGTDTVSTSNKVQPYTCLVLTAGTSPRQWTGRVTVVPDKWQFGETDSTFRLCRYSADYDGNGTIGNDEHPDTYTAVDKNLLNQNFLVIRGTETCPTDVAANPSTGDLVNSNTVQHEPATSN